MLLTLIFLVLVVPSSLANEGEFVPRRYGQPGQGRPKPSGYNPPGHGVTSSPVVPPTSESSVLPVPDRGTTTASPGSPTPLEKDQIYLSFINGYRYLHRAPPLIVDPALAELAQKCAEEHAVQELPESDAGGGKEDGAKPGPGAGAENPAPGPSRRAAAAETPSKAKEQPPCRDTQDANEASGISEAPTGMSAIVDVINRQWYANQTSELKWNGIDLPKYDPKTAQLTQMIWKATTKVGCGVSQRHDKGKQNHVTCFYKTKGNIQSGASNAEFITNVLRPM